MRQRIHDYLAERPDGAGEAELLALVFAGGGRDPEFGARFLGTLLGDDPRFRFSAADRRWRARVHDALERPLAEADFVVVDVETTGGSARDGAITEIGAVRVRGGRLLDEFQALVHPGRPIQPFVMGLTGITDAMVADAPPIHEVLPRFLDFAGDGAVLVAHDAAFDTAHLGAAHERVRGRPLALPAVCTIRLARRLLPELRRRGLDHLAAHLGISAPERHRALADARITAEVLCVLLERAAAAGVERVDQLIALQRRAADGRAFVVHVPPARIAAAPLAPGVYHLLDADGRVLYVGKARRLRERLRSYFVDARGHGAKTLELVRQVHDVRTHETGSELAASLLEMRHIRELKPPYNRQGRQLPRVAFLKLAARSAFPRLSVTQRLGVDRALYVGPFATRQAAERAQAVLASVFGLRTCAGALAPAPAVAPCLLGQLGSCPAPCGARIEAAAYRAGVDACVAFLDGADDEPLRRLAARRDAAAAALRYEAAGRRQRELDVLEDLRRRRRRLAWIVARQHFAVLVPTDDREAAQLYVVLGGRLAVEARIAASADLLAAVHVVAERFDRYRDAPLERGDVAASTVLAAWLRDRGQEGLLLPFEAPEALAARLDELVVTLDDLRERGPLPRIEGLG